MPQTVPGSLFISFILDFVHVPGQLPRVQGPDRRQVLRGQGDRGQGLCLRKDQRRGQVPR